VKLVTTITGVTIACTGTVISTIYNSNLRNLSILGELGRKVIHNNYTNLVTTVRKGTTGASATFVAKPNILTTVRLLNLVA